MQQDDSNSPQSVSPREAWQTTSKMFLDRSLENLDPAVLAQLAAAREQALRPARASGRRHLIWLSAAAASVLAASLLWIFPTQHASPPDGELVQILDDMELLENMEMLGALEVLADEV